MFCWHKWEKYGKVTSNYRGDLSYYTIDPEYRVCSKCGEVCYFMWDSQGGAWYAVEPELREQFHQKVAEGIFFSVKGNYTQAELKEAYDKR